MTLINKEIYERSVFISGAINNNAKVVIDLTDTVNDLIDEIANYKPLFSTRKKIQEQGPEYAIEHMKKVVATTIKLKLGEDNGNNPRLRDFDRED